MAVSGAYATLGVSSTATWADLRRAYRSQLQRYHPDTGAGDIRKLESVTAAYRELRARHVRAVPPVTLPDDRPAVGRLVDVYA